MKKYNFLAFDIGATSGRAVLGTLVGDKFEMQELHRFPNAIMELHGKYYWDIYRLYDALKESLTICARRNLLPDSIGIDTWGVDFGYLAEDGTLLGLPRAYRDPYTDGAPEEYFQRVPRSEVYRLTGIQIMNFNSVFQLFRAKKEGFGPLEAAEEILFMPDLLSYLLTGKKVCEYTDASTSGLLNPVTKEFEASSVGSGRGSSLHHASGSDAGNFCRGADRCACTGNGDRQSAGHSSCRPRHGFGCRGCSGGGPGVCLS